MSSDFSETTSPAHYPEPTSSNLFSQPAAELHVLVEQQDREIAMLKKRLEKAMRRPSKLELQKLKHENARLHKKLSIEADIVRALQSDILEGRSCRDQVVLLSDDLADLQSRFSVCQASRDSLVIDGDKLEAENRMLQMQIDQLLQSNSEDPVHLNELKELLKDRLAEGQSLTDAVQAELVALTKQCSSSSVEISNLTKALDERTSELMEAQRLIAGISEQMQFESSIVSDDIDPTVTSAERQLLADRVRFLESSLDDKDSELMATSARVGIIADQVLAPESALKENESELTSTRTELAALTMQFSESSEEIFNLNSALDERTSELIETQRILEQMRFDLEDKNSELLATSSMCQRLVEQVQSLESVLHEKKNGLMTAHPELAKRTPTGSNLGVVTDRAPPTRTRSHDAIVNDRDKFHHYQNRIENLEENLLELSATNTRLQQSLSSADAHLRASHASAEESWTCFRSEADILLKLLSQKEQLVDDLSSKLDIARVEYHDKMADVQATMLSLRRHNDRLQKLFNAEGLKLEDQCRVVKSNQPLKIELNVESRSNSIDSEAESLKFDLEAAQATIDKQSAELASANVLIDELRLELKQLAGDDLVQQRNQLNTKVVIAEIYDLNCKLENAHELIDRLRCELQSARSQISDQSRDQDVIQMKIEDLKQDLQDAQALLDQQRLELDVAQKRIHEQTRELRNAQAQIDEQRLEIKSARERLSEFENVQTQTEGLRRDLEAALAQIDEQRGELDSARSTIKEMLLELQSMKSTLGEQSLELVRSRSKIDEQGSQLGAAEIRLEEQRVELESAQSQIQDQCSELQAAERRVDELKRLGESIVRNYNELRGHYELLLAKSESESAVLEQITLSHSSRSLSSGKPNVALGGGDSASAQAAPIRSASVPMKKRRTLKEFLVKLFERPIYDENGKPISRVDLTEDTTFVWDSVKKKYIDLSAPESETKPISKPPPRPSFALSPSVPALSTPAELVPPTRKLPNRALTTSRYALLDEQPDPRPLPGPRSSSSLPALPDRSARKVPGFRGQAPPVRIEPNASSLSSNGLLYRPPVINVFDDVVVIAADYHSLVASLLALQKELAGVRRAKLETDVHVSNLVRQIKQRLVNAQLQSNASESMELTKLIYCIVAMAGIISALTHIPV